MFGIQTDTSNWARQCLWLHSEYGRENLQIQQDKFGVIEIAKRCWTWNFHSSIIYCRFKVKNCSLYSG